MRVASVALACAASDSAFTLAHKDFAPEPVVGCSYLLLPSYHKGWCAVFQTVLLWPKFCSIMKAIILKTCRRNKDA